MQGVWNVATLDAMDELHRLREELAEAHNRLCQAERDAVIGQNARVFSHEARNELSVLKISLSLLPQILDDPEETGEVVALLKRTGERLHWLLDDMRDIATPIRLNRDICYLSKVWRKAWSSLELEWKNRDVALDEDVIVQPLELIADSFRLEQVFRNLFENSLAACADPVVIDVSCTQSVNRKGRIALSVRDNGPGLPIEHMQKVFDPFFTTKTGGTGLGMTIVKRIVEAHGGRITVGKGTIHGAEFIIDLPVCNVDMTS